MSPTVDSVETFPGFATHVRDEGNTFGVCLVVGNDRGRHFDIFEQYKFNISVLVLFVLWGFDFDTGLSQSDFQSEGSG